MSAVNGWGGHLIFPHEIAHAAQRDPRAEIKILRATKARLYVQASVPAMHLRDAIFDLKRGNRIAETFQFLAARRAQGGAK